jgi:lipid-A-disaccharide synthase-like uncharacterized protein
MLVELSQAAGGYIHEVYYKLNWWTTLGFLAQIIFTGRFAVQLWASERAGKSIVPFSFWILSIIGGALLLLYALVQRDPVYIAAQLFSLLIYGRNVSFVLKERAADKAKAESEK